MLKSLFMIFIFFISTEVKADYLASVLQSSFEFVAGDPCYKKYKFEENSCPKAVYQKLQPIEEKVFFNKLANDYLMRNQCWIEKIDTLTMPQKSLLLEDIQNKMPMIADLDAQIKKVELERATFVNGQARDEDLERNKKIQDQLDIFAQSEDGLRRKLNALLGSTSLGDNFIAKKSLLKMIKIRPPITSADLQTKILDPIEKEAKSEQIALLKKSPAGRMSLPMIKVTVDYDFDLSESQKKKLFTQTDIGTFLNGSLPSDVKDRATLYCQVDDRYGVGRKHFDETANGLEFLATLAVPAGPYVAAAKGAITLRSARILSTLISLGVGGVSAAKNMENSCGPHSVNLELSKTCDSSQIPTDVYMREIKNYNCLLATGMTIATFATPLAAKAFLKVKSISGLTDADAELQAVKNSEVNRPNVPLIAGQGAQAKILDIKTAKAVAEDAWQKTEANLKLRGIKETPENEDRIKKIYDLFLCRELNPPPSLNCLFAKPSLRVLDAPHLEKAEVPDFIKRYLTVDHHNIFGKDLPENTNTSVQILDMLDPRSNTYVSKREFNDAFSHVASDNVGDAYGMATWITRNSDKIRGNPEMIEKLKILTRIEDFGLFGPEMNLRSNQTMTAVLGAYDESIPKMQNTFLDRTSLSLRDQSITEINSLQKKLDWILDPKTDAERTYAANASKYFNDRMSSAVDIVKNARVPVVKNEKELPIIFADTTQLKASTNVFQGMVAIPQYARAYAPSANSAFTISGSSENATRQLLLANFPGKGAAMNTAAPGLSQSFLSAILQAEKKAIERRLAGASLSTTERREASEKLSTIEQGKNVFTTYENGSLVFGATYMLPSELKTAIESNASLLGY